MLIIRIISVLIFLVSISIAQEKIEKMPSIKGGISDLAKNIKYPKTAKEQGISGNVIVKAIIDKNGNVAGTEVVKSISKELDEAAVTAVKLTKFIPGENKGKKVRAEVTIPIKFKLDNSKKKN